MVSGSRVHLGPQHSVAFPPEPETGFRNGWEQGKAQTPPFPRTPIPLLFTILVKIQALSIQPLDRI